MKTEINDAYIANKKLRDLKAEMDRFLSGGKVKNALKLEPQIKAARRTAAGANARLIEATGKTEDLWEAAALALAGGPVDVIFDVTGRDTLGSATDSIPPKIVIDPNIAGANTIYKTFLHEVGHAKDFYERDQAGVTSEDSEKIANTHAEGWAKYADLTCMRFDGYGRNGIEIRLRALAHYRELS